MLGHFQKDFEGGVSAENLGKFVLVNIKSLLLSYVTFEATHL